MPFTSTDLSLPDAELSQLVAALANSGVADPVGGAVAEAESVVGQYTARYTVAENWRKRLMRPLAIHALYALLGRIPDAHQKAYDAAMSELRDIRDGKFPDLAPAATPPTAAAPGSWGSQTQIAMRAGS